MDKKELKSHTNKYINQFLEASLLEKILISIGIFILATIGYTVGKIILALLAGIFIIALGILSTVGIIVIPLVSLFYAMSFITKANAKSKKDNKELEIIDSTKVEK